MKQRVLEQARRTVDAFLQRPCADTTLSVLAVMPEVDGDAESEVGEETEYRATTAVTSPSMC